MRPYSDDLRVRIIAAIERGEESWRQIARRFVVSVSCVIRLVQRYRETGTVQPKPHGGGQPPALRPDQLDGSCDAPSRLSSFKLRRWPPC